MGINARGIDACPSKAAQEFRRAGSFTLHAWADLLCKVAAICYASTTVYMRRTYTGPMHRT
jgi:hypothetical protein